MWFVLLILFSGLYAWRIIKECLRYGTIKHSIKLLKNFCSAYPSNRYEKELDLLLKQSSVIGEYVQSPRLSRTLLPNANYYNASKIRLKMMDKLDEQRHNILKSLNPVNAFRELIIFPVTIARLFGFTPKKWSSAALSVVGWGITGLVDMFQPEIKTLLLALFEYLK